MAWSILGAEQPWLRNLEASDPQREPVPAGGHPRPPPACFLSGALPGTQVPPQRALPAAFHLARCLQGPPTLWKVSEFHPFPWPDNVLRRSQTTVGAPPPTQTCPGRFHSGLLCSCARYARGPSCCSAASPELTGPHCPLWGWPALSPPHWSPPPAPLAAPGWESPDGGLLSPGDCPLLPLPEPSWLSDTPALS